MIIHYLFKNEFMNFKNFLHVHSQSKIILCFNLQIKNNYLSVFLIIQGNKVLKCRLKYSPENITDCRIRNIDIFRSIEGEIKKAIKLGDNEFRFLFLNQKVYSYIDSKKNLLIGENKFSLLTKYEPAIEEVEEFKSFILPFISLTYLDDFPFKDRFFSTDPNWSQKTPFEFFIGTKLELWSLNTKIFQILLDHYLSDNTIKQDQGSNTAYVQMIKDTNNNSKKSNIKPNNSNLKQSKANSDASIVSDSDLLVNSSSIDKIHFALQSILELQYVTLNKFESFYTENRDLIKSIQSTNSNLNYEFSNPNTTYSNLSQDYLGLTEDSNTLSKLIKSYRYQSEDQAYFPNLVVFDFELLKIVVELANFNGVQMKREKTSQLRIIYCLLWAFGLDLSELRNLDKQTIELSLSQQKIFSPKQNKFKILRQDESLGFILKTLTKELPLLFDYYEFKLLGNSARFKTLMPSNVFLTLPNQDLFEIFSKLDIDIKSYELSWKGLKVSYKIYFNKI